MVLGSPLTSGLVDVLINVRIDARVIQRWLGVLSAGCPCACQDTGHGTAERASQQCYEDRLHGSHPKRRLIRRLLMADRRSTWRATNSILIGDWPALPKP
jgi:hypothetical protein